MFGRRSNDPASTKRSDPQVVPVAQPVAPPEIKAPPQARQPAPAAQPRPEPPAEVHRRHSEEYYDVKTTVFNALIDTIDLTQLAKLDAVAAREEIRDIVSEIIQVKNVVMSIAEQEELLEDI
ncbi:MAG: CpaF family protein, partial [Hyphomicrobium denitrificans]|nr:CpaF family protein [Hyphomicrobium denitrificans]